MSASMLDLVPFCGGWMLLGAAVPMPVTGDLGQAVSQAMRVVRERRQNTGENIQLRLKLAHEWVILQDAAVLPPMPVEVAEAA